MVIFMQIMKYISRREAFDMEGGFYSRNGKFSQSEKSENFK